ncbi:MAG: lactonase family protein [Longimicrobiales bacterium]
MRTPISMFSAAVLVLAACSETDVLEPAGSDAAFVQAASASGAVYVLSNAVAGNAVLAFARAADGSLTGPVAYATGGTGTGAGLGSQGAVVLSDNGRWLFAVDAGSDELSVFRVEAGNLTLTDRVGSGGDMPISVTVRGRTVYVLNAGGSGNIVGYGLSQSGDLSPLAGSTQPLSGAGTGPAQVEFSPNGRLLVVTEKMTNMIVTYAVDSQGIAGPPQANVSAGATPFGFAFSGSNRLIVSEAFGGAADASATSSYFLRSNGAVETISASVGTTETAACWVVVSRNGRFAYVTNTGSGTVTGYEIGRGGRLFLLDADGETAQSGPGPIDAAFSDGDRFLFVLNAGDGSISGFGVGPNGNGLSAVGGVSGLPAGAVGLAAH